jgi:hypothetical protein
VVKNEGVKSLFKGAGANILRAVAGAGVLSGYDQLQVIMFGEWRTPHCLMSLLQPWCAWSWLGGTSVCVARIPSMHNLVFW